MQWSDAELRKRTGNPRQFAAVRQITLEDGPALGMRALSFSTGGGLDFWVFNDRSMDIGPLWVQGMPLAWVHPAEFPSPALNYSEGDGGSGIERALSGFMVTCGLDNVRQPSQGKPLHGHLPLTPARLMGCGENWQADEPYLYAEGEMVSAHLNRSSFSLQRRIEAPIGGRRLTIVDRIRNIGVSDAEMKILYHTNLGFPFVQDGLSVYLGDSKAPCYSVDSHSADAEADISCHEVAQQSEPTVRLSQTQQNSPLSTLGFELQCDTEALPFVQLWSDPRPGRNILAIEPANCSRQADGTSGPGRWLAPGESCTLTLSFDFDSAKA